MAPAESGGADWIVIRGIRCRARVGVERRERRAEQLLQIDVRLGLDLREAAETDDVRSTIDYASAVRQVQEAVSREPAALIESVAARVCDLLLEMERVQIVTVRVRKFPADLRDEIEWAEVDFTRLREPGLC